MNGSTFKRWSFSKSERTRTILCAMRCFVLMRQNQVAEALTTDRHFEQEGFIRLLPEVGP
jgi:hypothetical protein